MSQLASRCCHTSLILFDNHNSLAVYESARQSMLRFVRNAVKQGPDPEQVARRIVQLATSAAPPLRSYVGPRARLLVALRQWLPQRIFERVRRRVFQL